MERLFFDYTTIDDLCFDYKKRTQSRETEEYNIEADFAGEDLENDAFGILDYVLYLREDMKNYIDEHIYDCECILTFDTCVTLLSRMESITIMAVNGVEEYTVNPHLSKLITKMCIDIKKLFIKIQRQQYYNLSACTVTMSPDEWDILCLDIGREL